MFTPNITIKESVERYLDRIREISPDIKLKEIEKAYRFSWQAHKNQKRKSGIPFLSHPVAVSMILAEQGFDWVTVSAALLHDVVEDTTISISDIEKNFGQEIAALVDGVTKIDSIHIGSREQRQVETYRKMLLSMSKDIRVIIIKFADRLHNLRTLKFLPDSRIKAIATETLEIYAPLAHRLGMAKIKWELEDLAFKYLHKKEYKEIVSNIVAKRYDRETTLDNVITPLKNRLESKKIKATISGRPKHFYSVYRKMNETGRPFDEIYDLIAIRVITRTIEECYLTLYIVHSMWRPLTDKFKDYIAVPKSNGYQSIHTTIIGPDGKAVEVQIRTMEMHYIAEEGIAAHWMYKEKKTKQDISSDDTRISWLKNLIEWQKELKDSREFYEFFKVDISHAEIFVFTPKGDLHTLPKGATVLDFAFSVHTELGLHCIGAVIDGNAEPVDYELKNSSTVEILHLNTKTPEDSWLKIVKTAKARSAIKRWLNSNKHKESIELGRRLLATEFKEINIDISALDHNIRLPEYLGYSTMDAVYEKVGLGQLSVEKVLSFYKIKDNAPKRNVSSRVTMLMKTISRDKKSMVVGNNSNTLIRYAPCCSPIPGDSIVGFMTKGRGLVVHKKDCQNVKFFKDDPEKTVSLTWASDSQIEKKYVTFIEIKARNISRVYESIVKAICECGAKIKEGFMSDKENTIFCSFRVEIKNSVELKKIFKKLQKVNGVESVVRVKR